MLQILLFLLLLLWLTGNLSLPIVFPTHIVLFYINSRPITLWNVIALFVIIWIIGLLPSPLRQIATILAVLWVLSLIGIIVVAGLSGVLLTLLVVVILLKLFRVL